MSRGLNGKLATGLKLPECESELGLFVAFDAELADALNELLEVDFTVAVSVKNFDYSLEERPWQKQK